MPPWRVGKCFGYGPLVWSPSSQISEEHSGKMYKNDCIKRKKKRKSSCILLLTSMTVTQQSQFPGKESSPSCPISRK